MGTPQGGCISPLLANLVLDGLEPMLKESVIKLKRRATRKRSAWSPQVNVVR
jgi:RNA-directed DNA polymerase